MHWPYSAAWPAGCMDAPASASAPCAQWRVLAHIRKLDDCFGQFLVRVTAIAVRCVRSSQKPLARLVGWSMTLEELAQRMRCSQLRQESRGGRSSSEATPPGNPEVSALNSLVTRAPQQNLIAGATTTRPRFPDRVYPALLPGLHRATRGNSLCAD